MPNFGWLFCSLINKPVIPQESVIHSVKSVHLLVILPWRYVLTFMLVNKGIIWILYLSWLNTPETRPIPGLPFMSCCFTAQCCSTNDSLLVGYCYYTDIPQDVQKQDMIWFYLMSWYCIQFKLSLWWSAVTWNVNFRNSLGWPITKRSSFMV